MFANTDISMLPLVSTFHQLGATFMGTPVLTGPKSLVTGMQHDTNFGIFYHRQVIHEFVSFWGWLLIHIACVDDLTWAIWVSSNGSWILVKVLKLRLGRDFGAEV